MREVVTILLSKKHVKSDKKQNNDLLWYDAENKKMQMFKGGYLNFEYKKTENGNYKMEPKVMDLYQNALISVDNKEEIIKMIDIYNNYNRGDITILSSDDIKIEVNVSNIEKDDFIYECERKGLKVL